MMVYKTIDEPLFSKVRKSLYLKNFYDVRSNGYSVEDHNFGPLSNSQVKGNVLYVFITRKCDLLKGST
jgi:hypothetical protein